MLIPDEKRDFMRMSTNCQLIFNEIGSKETFNGTCLDLSGAGISFETARNVEAGQAFEISIIPEKDFTPPLDALIEVIRCKQVSTTTWQVAASIKGIKGN